MKAFLEKYRWMRLVIGVIVVALGLTLIIVAAADNGTQEITKTFCIIFGICCMVSSVISILLCYFLELKGKMTISTAVFGLILAIGILFTFQNQNFATVVDFIIQNLVSYGLICVGGVLLIQSIIEIIMKYEPKQWLGKIIFGAVGVTVGIIFVANAESVSKTIYIIVGSVVAVIGLFVTITSIIFMVEAKNQAKNVVDVVPNEEIEQKEEK